MNAIILTGDRTIETAGKLANQYAAGAALADYMARRSPNTLRRQRADLDRFADFLAAMGINGIDGITGERLAAELSAWTPITHGLVMAYRAWMVRQGDAIGSINVRLTTVRTYVRLAHAAGYISDSERALIGDVGGYEGREAVNVDAGRERTRRGAKKAAATIIEPVPNGKPGRFCQPEIVKALKGQPDTPQGRRDAVIICLLFDHGLRVGEVARLNVSDIHSEGGAGTLTFYREKVNKVQTHTLTPDTARALRSYLDNDAPAIGRLLRGSNRAGELTEPGMSTQAINRRVGILGQRVGIDGLSPHDARHFWATLAAKNRTPIERLMDGGGWSSPAMPLRYIEAAKIANDGIDLGEG